MKVCFITLTFLVLFSIESKAQYSKDKFIEIGLIPALSYNSISFAYSQKKELREYVLVGRGYYYTLFFNSFETGYGIYSSHNRYKANVLSNKIYFSMHYGIKKSNIYSYKTNVELDEFYKLFVGAGLGLKVQKYANFRRIELIIGLDLKAKYESGNLKFHEEKPIFPSLKFSYRTGIKLKKDKKAIVSGNQFY